MDKTSDPMAGMQDMARQMFETWQQAMSGAAAGSAPPPAADPAAVFRQGMDWWAQMSQQATAGRPADGIGAAFERLSSQAGPWLAMMQQLGGRFDGGQGSAAEITKAWRSMVEATGANPLADAMRNLSGGGSQDWSRWMQDAGPMLAAFGAKLPDWTRQPAFGFAREHQERQQRLASAAREYFKHQQAHDRLMHEALRQAFPKFEDKLAERSEPGRQIDSMRGLFDVWVDAAEEAYAEVALSEEFRHAYANMVNAMMRLRQALQGELEISARALGMPTRTDVDAGHQRLQALEREVRRLRSQLVELAIDARGDAAPGDSDGTPRRAARKTPAAASRKRAATRSGSAGGARDEATDRALARQSAAKPAAESKPAARKRAAAKPATSKKPARKAARKSVRKTPSTRNKEA